MTQNPMNTPGNSDGAMPLTAPYLAVAAAATSLGLLAFLHLVESEFDPSWRFVSEYANGPFGWLLTLTFLSLALSCVALVAAVRSHVQTIGGTNGLGLLLIAAVALTVAAFNAIDPITSTSDQLTTHGNIHGLASMIGVPGLAIAALLVSIGLGRNPGWATERRSLRWAGVLPLVALVLMFAVIGATLPQAGGFGSEVPVGWPNRLLMLAYATWLLTVAGYAIRKRRHDIKG